MIRRPSTVFLRHISARIGVDRAVIYGMLGTAQVFLTGPVTALIIAFSLTTEVQGYYYTFAALLALQVLVELGFAQVIMQFASHEWAHLRLRDDRSIEGDAAALSRLTSLARLSTKWYWRFSVVLGTGLAVAGILFFNDAGSADVGWKGPWIAIAALTAVDFMMLPLWSLLQGANQMAAVNFARLVSGLLLVVMLWGGLSLGAGLWSVAAAKAVSLTWDIGYVVRYRRFFGSLLRKRAGPAINWRSEILPVQWRTAVTYMSSYFVFSLFVPVIFRYEGPAEAGRWGMTWGLVMAVSALSTSWFYTRAPTFGVLIAQRRYAELDAAWRKVTAGAIGLCLLTSAVGVSVIAGIRATDLELGNRLLPAGTAACLFAAIVLTQISVAQSTYLRAHKAEPLFALSFVTGVCIAGMTVVLGATWGTTGIAVGYLVFTALVVLPWTTRLFTRLRREWHAPEIGADDETRGGRDLVSAQ
jgi:hypothetical protein